MIIGEQLVRLPRVDVHVTKHDTVEMTNTAGPIIHFGEYGKERVSVFMDADVFNRLYSLMTIYKEQHNV